jgi:pilus assembly protein Flp/PilA
VESKGGSQPSNEVEPKMLDLIRRITRCEQGATAVEYGLIVSLVVITLIVALGNVAGSTTNMWNDVTNTIVDNTG